MRRSGAIEIAAAGWPGTGSRMHSVTLPAFTRTVAFSLVAAAFAVAGIALRLDAATVVLALVIRHGSAR